MKEIPAHIIAFFKQQGFAIVCTLDEASRIHCSAKGIVSMEKEGMFYLIDVYRGRTFANLRANPTISVTAINEHQFIGYTLKGTAHIVERGKIKNHIMKSWEEHVIRRISERVVTDIKRDHLDTHHPESRLPVPEYLIEVDVEEIIDLTPAHLKRRQARQERAE